MYCKQCGTVIADDSRFCPSCGTEVKTTTNSQPKVSRGNIGYSNRINDPIFSKNLRIRNRSIIIFTIILAIVSVVGFTIYSNFDDTVDSGEATIIGIGIAIMFIIIGVFSLISQKTSKTWDGVVVDKKSKRKSRSDDEDITYYIEYTVYIRSEKGKNHKLVTENKELYDYYKVGDKVRHHAGFFNYEKYDKSNDSVIFCISCNSKNKITDDKCHLCKSPLLK